MEVDGGGWGLCAFKSLNTYNILTYFCHIVRYDLVYHILVLQGHIWLISYVSLCNICSRYEVKSSEVPIIFIIVYLGNKLTTTPISLFLESTYIFMLFSNNYVLVYYVLRTLVLIDEILCTIFIQLFMLRLVLSAKMESIWSIHQRQSCNSKCLKNCSILKYW